MQKLNKRQIVILVVAALFVLYAGYELLIAGPAAKKAKIQAKPVEISSYVNALSSDLSKNKVSDVDAYIAKRAELDWHGNPFWDRTSYREFVGKDAISGAGAKLIYSGYVDTGRAKMAIINGCEYGVGESLDVEGYVLKAVAPSSVLIQNRNTGGELSVPIQE